MFAVTATEFTSEGAARVIINQYTPVWLCPRGMLSFNGLQFAGSGRKLSIQLFGVHKIAVIS